MSPAPTLRGRAWLGRYFCVADLRWVSLSLNPVAVCWEPAVKLSLPWPILSPESFLEHLDLKSVSGSEGENNVLLDQLLQPQ